MMIFSNLTLSGFKYIVDNPGLLTVLNNHVVTCFGRSKPEDGNKLLTETQYINFDVLLTVHLSIFISVFKELDA